MLAVIELHPERSCLGFPFPWDTPLQGKPPICHTLEAITACASIDHIVLVLPAEVVGLEQRVRPVVERIELPPGKKLSILSETGRDAAEHRRMARWRRLAPSAWRAGWAIPFAVTEWGDPRRLLAVLERTGAEEMILFPPAAPLMSASLVEEIIAARVESRDAILRLSTLPPGASGDILTRTYLENVVGQDITMDHLIRFLPDHPERDLDTKGPFHWYSRDSQRLRHRLTVDSKRSLSIVESIMESHGKKAVEDGFLEDLARSPEGARLFRGPVPAELRMIVTSRVQAPSIFDFPVAEPGDMELALFDRVAATAGNWQEVRLVISGGEPLLHPRLGDMIHTAHEHGVGAVVLETTGLDLSPAHVDAFHEGVDVVIVKLDAVRPETYARLHGHDRLGEAERSVEQLLEAYATGDGPAVAVELREVEENRDESEAFFDRWFPRTPWTILAPYSDGAGQRDRRPLHPYRMSERVPCIQIEESLTVHPDGRAACCRNDLLLSSPAGDLDQQTLEEVWGGERLEALRAAHADSTWAELPLCATCDDWCRRS